MNVLSAFSAAARSEPAHVVVAESGSEIRDGLMAFMTQRDLTATAVENGAELVRALAAEAVDAVILDQYLGQEDGLAVLRQIRASSPVPVIVIGSEYSGEIDRVVALEIGADDYLSRPFGMRELLARIRAVRRRCGAFPPPRAARYKCYAFEEWQFDQRQRCLRTPERAELDLTKSDFALLSAFVAAPGRILSREELLQATRRHEDIYDRSIDVQVLRLRRKLRDDPREPRLIRTARGVGYVFAAEVQVVRPAWTGPSGRAN